MIRARELRFSYPQRPGEERFSLHLPAWEVAAGGRVALFGPSGCGKSTLLNLVAGVLCPDAGSLSVAGSDLAAMSEVERRAWRIKKMGFVFQDFPLVDYLPAEENVLLPYRLNPALSLDSAARARARDLLGLLGIGQMTRRRPGELSQGERQRVAIARALVTEPSVLLADEPAAGLDPECTTSLMDHLDSLSEDFGLTLLLVTHDPGLLERFSSRLAVEELRA
ncbi:MAG TPA: ATP-binding cassette domain-containing protein [Myxococcota bacterium]|nr:ATP-binding cassette domain-containing protein [Myxococcota bacterium]